MKKITIFTVFILIIIFIFIIYFQSSLTKSNITSSTTKATGMVVEEQKQIEKETAPVNEEKEELIRKEEAVIEKPFPETFLTNAECIDGKEITFTLNNILKKKVEPSKLIFYAAGRTVRNPVCDKQNLNPGESTNCKIISNFKFNKIIQFTIAYPGNSQSINVNC